MEGKINRVSHLRGKSSRPRSPSWVTEAPDDFLSKESPHVGRKSASPLGKS
jgi:hypothetical protein